MVASRVYLSGVRLCERLYLRAATLRHPDEERSHRYAGNDARSGVSAEAACNAVPVVPPSIYVEHLSWSYS